MIDLSNIHSLSDFRQNTKKYVEQLQADRAPLVLTINGEASIVVEDASMFQETQNRLRQLEEELHAIKYEQLKAAVMAGVQQMERGAFGTKTLEDIEADVLAKHQTANADV